MYTINCCGRGKVKKKLFTIYAKDVGEKDANNVAGLLLLPIKHGNFKCHTAKRGEDYL